ncbi:MAG TPA: FtsX-like permease family protein [Usitatibacter sp.]|jgi:putative ABC transport system permease protein|nr:FtsX-like permease family protein [Usitatibacter sp.]
MNAAVAWAFVRGSLRANRLRWLLTVCSIAIGVALAGAVHTLHASALAEIDRSAHALAGSADLEVRGPSTGFDDAVFVRIARDPHVRVASPVLELEAPVAGVKDSLRVLGIDAFRASRLQPGYLVDAGATSMGQSGGLLDPGAVFLSPAAAARRHVQAGGSVTLVAAHGPLALRVGGILAALQSGGEVAVMDIAAAQAHFDRVGRITRIDLRLAPGADPAETRHALEALLPPGVVLDAPGSISQRAAAITRAYRVNLDALALVALATGAFLVFSTLALQAARRRQELALLRALGVTRRGIAGLLTLEGGLMGCVGAALGTATGLGASRLLLRRVGADLGAGYFSGEGGVYAPDAAALAFIAGLGIAMSALGALWVARAVARMPVADALRDRSVEIPGGTGGARIAIALVALGIPLLLLPSISGLPLGGYGAIAAWLAAAAAAVGPLCRALLARIPAPRSTLAALALAQVRDLPGHLAASIAGIVVSASLCVAMAIMVHSFRVSLEDWLAGVVGADLYVRSSPEGDSGFFTPAQEARVAALPAVAAVEPLRYVRVVLSAHEDQPLSVIARPITPRLLAGFDAQPPPRPAAPGEIRVWISEAARDLHGWHAGDRIRLPIGGRSVDVRVGGVIRDYARTWGAVMFPLDAYRRLTGDLRANDFALHLAPGADVARAETGVREALRDAPALQLEDAGSLKRRSLELFDRSFAVTYALEAIAIAIGLAGVTSSFAALAWSRRREFGVLRFLGLTRREVLRMIALEGAAAGTVGALLGLACGAALSAVLVHVVNRQAFHWTLALHWPVPALALFVAAVVLLCAVASRASGRLAVRREAILAVKDDA